MNQAKNSAETLTNCNGVHTVIWIKMHYWLMFCFRFSLKFRQMECVFLNKTVLPQPIIPLFMACLIAINEGKWVVVKLI